MRCIFILQSSDIVLPQLSQPLEGRSSTYHGPGLALGARHGNSLLGGIVQQVVSPLESLVEFRDTPRRNNLDGGLQGVKGQFKADLIVALARTAVGYELTALLLGDCDLSTGNDWASERCA